MARSILTKQRLSERIESLLSRQNSVVEAAKLADFTFEAVCLERDRVLGARPGASSATIRCC